MLASDFLTTAEAAARMGISRATLARRVRRGNEVPQFVRVDERVWRWRATDVEVWVRARECGGDTSEATR